MGLSWQQGPLGRNPNGQFLVPGMPERVLYAEPLRRRLRAELGGQTVVESDDAVRLFEPGRYPVAYFPLEDFAPGALRPTNHRTHHHDLGETAWFEVAGGTRDIDIRHSSRHLVVRANDTVIADTRQPLVLYESGFAPRWYVRRADVHADALADDALQTFCPYKGIASYYDIEGVERAAWSYRTPFADMASIADRVSFEPDKVEITLDGVRLEPEPGQAVVAHGVDRDLTVEGVTIAA
jgi:uncharacterized protein (DUF427 family)